MTGTIPTPDIVATPNPSSVEPTAVEVKVLPGPVDRLDVEDVVSLLSELAVWPTWPAERQQRAQRGARRLLRWLLGQDGDGWQARWVASGADAETDLRWLVELPAPESVRSAKYQYAVNHDGFIGLLLGQVIRPSHAALSALRNSHLLKDARSVIQPAVFERISAQASTVGLSQRRAGLALNVLSRLVLHTGLELEQLGTAEFEEFRLWTQRDGAAAPAGIVAAWDLVRAVGFVPANTPYRAARNRGPRPTTELVDWYDIRHGAVRDVLIRYLNERRPGLDYKSLLNMVGLLAGRFWADIQAHHPDVDSLDLPEPVISAWKERLKVVTTRRGETKPRRNYLPILIQVRSFYLDIQEWALQDPSWAPHAVSSPVRRGETNGLTKQRRRTTAAMHQRVRERLPRLPVLVATAERHHADQESLLAAATGARVGDEFEHNGSRYRRTIYRRARAIRADEAILTENLDSGDITDVAKAEDDAFWAWAVIETLRHTGVRLEELLEITHLALVSYRLPDTGEVVPLLQVLPSKTDHERLLLIGPELASALATVVSRLRGANDGVVPLTSRYDRHERAFGPLLPALFQRRNGHRNEVMSVTTVQDLLNATLARSGLSDAAGEPLRFTPHDFRRMFATEAVAGGLPVHITARLLGHTHIASTEPYLAVFQDDLIRSYRSFLDQRRGLRPEAEYREPTDEEWREFQQHFALRKLELGTCARPYGTPCKHEHACIRCPMLHVDPAQRHRLAEIAGNLSERIAESKLNGWLGEVEGLQTSLAAARDKLANLDRSRAKDRASVTELGLPVVGAPS